jgi:hypothetical protein
MNNKYTNLNKMKSNIIDNYIFSNYLKIDGIKTIRYKIGHRETIRFPARRRGHPGCPSVYECLYGRNGQDHSRADAVGASIPPQPR